jgi:hypothetical protein
MPRFDGTGPWGMGPMTGWGLGPCGAGQAWRRGLGRGFGRGFWGYGPYYPAYPDRITKEEEKELLAAEAEDLEEELKEIKERLAELENQK